ncbi:hypothetical protein PR202_gb12315 [Eleusine coracana subsp. coracana]|uniref:FBD domain-containing protein n=1 Tax=Eleusine coracana subsp. coracana TaxID=191504 RepID=A0AAV5EPQ3_ELECO|nr:hypothetical protein PR202_gb12315 [Eleusine coracana subsp. coracana]
MEMSGGKVAVKRTDLSSFVADSDEDRLLARSATTSCSSSSAASVPWPPAPRADRIHDALDAHVGALCFLRIATRDASPESVASWLPVAAGRVSGILSFRNLVPRGKPESGDDVRCARRSAIELPCFQSATVVELDLGFLSLAVSPAGVFAGLTELYLSRIRFQVPCDLGDAISSRRCSCLQKLSVLDSRGLNKLTVNSRETEKLMLNSLREVEIIALGDSEHEVTFMKQLFNWETVLKKLTITFNHSITESEAKAFCQMLGSFSRREICIDVVPYVSQE